MTETKPISLDASSLNSETKSTTPDSFDKLAALIVTALALSSFAFWWPAFATVARFAFLCCFPAIFPFCYALARSAPGLREPQKHRALAIMAIIHCVLLTGLVFAWRVFSTRVTIGNPDVVFGFMAVEAAVMILLVRLTRRKPKEE